MFDDNFSDSEPEVVSPVRKPMKKPKKTQSKPTKSTKTNIFDDKSSDEEEVKI